MGHHSSENYPFELVETQNISLHFTSFLCSFGEKVHVLCNEIKLDFARAMNKISFDKTVTHMPQKFWYVTLPEDEKAVVPGKGNMGNVL